MKNEKQILGEKGEVFAIKYLKKNKYKIIDCNYWAPYCGEIDIIARKKGVYIFIEVKTRSGDFLNPREAVDEKKEKTIHQAAWCFLKQYELEEAKRRFDIIEVVGFDFDDFKINHLENAFFK